MLQIINANNNPFFVHGDIHGEFEDFFHQLTNIMELSDINLLICGDVGLGFYRPNYYNTLFKKIQKKLSKRNIHVYAFRGNHDNPEFFKNNDKLNEILNGVKNIHIVDDYDIIKNDNHTILCIGGARSIDKCQRWKWDFHTQKQIPVGWWEGENVIDMPNNFEDFLSANNLNIDTICSHTAPDFCEPLSKECLLYWAKYDDTLIEDCTKERSLLTNIFNKLKISNNIKYWLYGHFHAKYLLYDNDIMFRCVDMFVPGNKLDMYDLN